MSTFLARKYPQAIEVGEMIAGPFCAHCGQPLSLHGKECGAPALLLDPCCGCHGVVSEADMQFILNDAPWHPSAEIVLAHDEAGARIGVKRDGRLAPLVIGRDSTLIVHRKRTRTLTFIGDEQGIARRRS